MSKLQKNKKQAPVLRFRAVNRDIFLAIASGKKRVETRAATKKYANIQAGDEIVFLCGREKFKKTVRGSRIFSSISALLKTYSVQDINPLVHTERELRDVYHSFPGYREKIKKFGLITLELE